MPKSSILQKLRSVLSGYADKAYFSPMWHCVVPLIGISETRVLSALFTVFLKIDSLTFRQDEDDKVWVQITQKDLSYFAGSLSIRSLAYAKERLVELGFIETSVEIVNNSKQPLWWSFDFDKFGRFFDFAKAFDCNFNPLNYGKTQEWKEFYLQNPDVVNEFKGLVQNFQCYIPNEASLCPQKENHSRDNTRDFCESKISESRENSLAKKVRENVTSGKKKKRIDVKPDKYIEFWNSLPNVPKCKIGYDAYEKCRAFFRAFKEYKAGSELFPLDTQLQKDIQLKTINRSSRRAPKCGPKQIPMRPDEEMFEWIKVAANAYSPDYVPIDKAHLPKSLYQFLYNDHSPKHGQYSIFLEKLWVNPPLTIDEDTYDRLWDHADADVQEMYVLFQGWYNIANGRDRDARFSLKDHKRLLSIARDWCDYYYKDLKEAGYVMPGSIEIPYFEAYVSYIKDVAPVNDFYDGMPLGTFKKCGQFWKVVLGEDSCIDY